MTSNINPNDINGAYPVAGQDNNSQGFRDNFTNTKTNFQYAADEITDLQNKVVLKAALTGQTLNNNMQGATISNLNLMAPTANVTALGTTSSSVTLNYAVGPYFSLTTNGPVALGFSNLPAAGVEAQWTLSVNVASTAHTITFPTAVSVNTTGIQGLNTSTNVMSFAAIGTYSFTFVTVDGGTTIGITENNKEIQPFNNSVEIISSSGNCNLAVTTTVFSVTGNVTAALGTGVPGQIRTFVLANVSGGGNAIVSVANAGWKTADIGNIVLTANGQGVTLQCVNVGGTNYDWFAIGNNGATFS